MSVQFQPNPTPTKTDSHNSLEWLESLSNRELLRAVNEIQLDIKRMKSENSVFENFLKTNEPTLIEKMDKTLDKVQEMQTKPTAEPFRTASLVSELRMGGQDTQSILSRSQVEEKNYKAKGPRINFSQRMDLLLREMDDIQTSLKQFIVKVHLEKNRLIAEIEETAIRDAELKEARNNFEQIVVIEGIEELTQKIPAEKFVRYMQEWLKFAQVMLEKLRLRTFSLRTQYHKLKLLLTQKEEMGECVHEVDFEQLHIANKNFQLAIEQKNKNLLELKYMNGKVNFMLTAHKNFLQKQQVTVNEIKERVIKTAADVDKLETDYDKTMSAIEIYQDKFDDLTKVTSKYTVPDVMEYIVKKAELAELKRTLKVWMRKIKIQKMAMGTYMRTMCQLTGRRKPNFAWFESTISTPDSLSVIEASKEISSFIHQESFFKVLEHKKDEDE